MRYLIASDIHGSWPRLQQLLGHFEAMKMDMLFILGDILNYGPRNGVPEGLNAPAIAEALNRLSDRIVAIRGNCDSEVDQMLLKFPIMSDYTMIVDNGVRLFLTHGHIYNETNMPTAACDAFIYGHTHLWKLEKTDGITVCNTGSITFPKGGNAPTFVTYADRKLRIHSLEGEVLKETTLQLIYDEQKMTSVNF